MPVVLQVRPATRRVDDHLRLASGKGVHVVPSELACALAVAGVRVQSATAGLLLGDAYDVSVAFEKAPGRALGVAEGLAHDAAGEDAHVRALAVDTAERSALRRRRQGRRPAEAAGRRPWRRRRRALRSAVSTARART